MSYSEIARNFYTIFKRQGFSLDRMAKSAQYIVCPLVRKRVFKRIARERRKQDADLF